MTDMHALRPGTIGFGPIHGPAGLLVNVGQSMLLEGFTVGRLKIKHVFVVTANYAPTAMQVIEAMPGGAQRNIWGDRWTSEYAYVMPPEDYAGQAADAASIALAMEGTPYSFASYGALALWKTGLKTPRLERWINRRNPAQVIPSLSDHGMVTTGSAVALPVETICSVLADQAWTLTGKKIMEGVAHQCVTPGALAGRLLMMPHAEWTFPGV